MLSPTAAERMGPHLGRQNPGCCGLSSSKQLSCSILLPDVPSLKQPAASANLDFHWKETVTEGKSRWWRDIKYSWAD